MSRVLLLALLCALLAFPAGARASASGIVVSQIYGGGGNSGASFRNDYVELFNAGATSVDVSGWTVQYATAAGTTWQPTPLSGTIAPGRYYLVQLASTADVGAALPAPDATGTSNLAATSGKIALVRGTAALVCGATAGSCSADPLVEDFVGYGAAGDFEGAGSAPAPSSTLAVVRAADGCVDTDGNAADFATATPSPRNSVSPEHSCGGAPSPTASGSVHVDLDVTSVLKVSLDPASLSFGTAAAGDTPAPLPEDVTVSSNNAAGYSLGVARTAFAPRDLPLAIGATAPAGGKLGSALGSGLTPIPIAPAAALVVGTKDGPSSDSGDVWATRIGFSSPVPLVSTGRYAATVAVATGLVLAPTSSAMEAVGATRPPVAISVSPARIALTAPGSRTIRLRNVGAKQVVVDTARKALGPRQAASTWLTVVPARLLLRPGSTAVFTLRVDPRRRAAPGDHHALLLLIARPLTASRVTVRMRLGIVVRARVQGRIVRRLVLQGVRVRRNGALRVLLVSVVNRGNVSEKMNNRMTIVLVRGGRVLGRLRVPARELLPAAHAVFRARYAGSVRGFVTAVVTVRPRPPGRSVARAYRIRL
jgi:Lamin Tail Domain